jgi:hypothetical protein
MDRAFELKFIEWLHGHGHLWGADNPNGHNVQPEDLDKLTIKHPIVVAGIKSFQASDANMDPLMWGFHQRVPDPSHYDGDAGPATIALSMGVQGMQPIHRCPLPDNPPPPNARFHYDDPVLQGAVESMQRAAAEGPPMKGAYWRGCDPQAPSVHSLVIGIDTRQAPSHFKANQEHILSERRRIAAEIGVSVRFVINPTSMTGLQQYQVYRGMGGSVIGRNYFPQRNSCGKIPNGDMSSSYNPSNLALHISLGTHESEGHGFGFNHVRGGFMNSSIIVSPLTWKGDPSWSQVIAFYPGSPLIEVVPLPPPGPGPTPPDVYPLIDPIFVTVAGKKYRYIPIPSPQL